MDLVEKKFRNLEIEIELERLKEEIRRGQTGNHCTKSQTNERQDPFRNDKISQYYKILCLQPFASLEEVKRAYRDQVEVWHPDRFTHNPRLQKVAEEKLKEINEAYKELRSSVHGSR